MGKILHRYPLLALLLGLGVGIQLASIFPFQQRGVWLLLTAISGAGIYVLRGRRGSLVLLTVLGLSVGVWRLGTHFFLSPPEPLGRWMVERSLQRVQLEALEPCRGRDGFSQFKARVLGWYEGKEFRPVDWRLRVTVASSECSVLAGQRFRALGRFQAFRDFQNPSSFDASRYWRGQGLWGKFEIQHAAWLLPWRDSRSSLQRTVDGVKQDAADFFLRHASPETAAVLNALLLGARDALPESLETSFRRLGLTHLIVVSGLHFTWLTVLTAWPWALLFSWRRRWHASGRGRIAANLLALGFAYLYGGLVGWSASVLRSWGMTMLSWVGWRLGGRHSGASMLLLSAWVLLLWQPLWWFDIGFQFSFLSVAMVMLTFARWQGVWSSWFSDSRRGKIGRGVLALFFSSTAVSLALFPWAVSVFHEVAWLAPAMNVFFVPAFSALLAGGAVSQLSRWLFPTLALWSLKFTESFLQISLGFLKWAASYPVVWHRASLDGVSWLFYVLVLFVFFRGINLRFATLLVALMLLWATGAALFSAQRDLLEVIAFDVGQGDAFLLRFPDGEAVLVDGGGLPGSDFALGKEVLWPELERLGIRELRAVVLTHPDADHYLGLVSLLPDISVREFWSPPLDWSNPELQGLKHGVEHRGLRRRVLSQGQRLNGEGVSLEALWPALRTMQDFSDNNASLVLRVCYQENCLLLTGDLEAEAEQALPPEALASAVLKVGHHGSQTSTSEDFLRRVNPKIALISAGRQNRYGHPHAQVLKNLTQQGSLILRTDLHGQIVLQMSKDRIDYRTYSGLEGTLGIADSGFWASSQLVTRQPRGNLRRNVAMTGTSVPELSFKIMKLVETFFCNSSTALTSTLSTRFCP